MIEGSGAGSVPRTNGSGSGGPKTYGSGSATLHISNSLLSSKDFCAVPNILAFTVFSGNAFDSFLILGGSAAEPERVYFRNARALGLLSR